MAHSFVIREGARTTTTIALKRVWPKCSKLSLKKAQLSRRGRAMLSVTEYK